ncbi:MAG TPA: hypothetical protein VF998_11710 [Candidatus Limnocylindria bacterium]
MARSLARVGVIALALVVAGAACSYVPTLPRGNNAPQEVRPPIPRLP